MFEWYGPLHHCIVWPLYLFPVNAPISPSWILKNFPEVSGDRFGEFLGFFHTLDEALALCLKMKELWGKGVEIMENLRQYYVDDPPRIADMDLASAIYLQIKSCCNVLEFYRKRERMLFEKVDELDAMRAIVHDEIGNSEKMCALCSKDSRLGYHSEAEGYLFFPAKLKARIELLHELLNEDFPRFDLESPWVKEYTGENPRGTTALLYKKDSLRTADMFLLGGNLSWQGEYDENNLYLTISGCRGKNLFLSIEPGRMSAAFSVTIRQGDVVYCDKGIFRTPPEIKYGFSGNDLFLTIPLNIFDGFWRKNHPMRMNIWSTDEPELHWVEPDLWPGRLQHGPFNPESFGWLVFAD